MSDINYNSISSILSTIYNKYSGGAEQKHLCQLYDIGVILVNRKFNKIKIIQKINKIIDDRSYDVIKEARKHKKIQLIKALRRGITDAMSKEYRMAYNNSNEYRYDDEMICIRARIESVLHAFQ